MKQTRFTRFLLVKDDFYAEPQRVVEAARCASYHEPPDATGFRSRGVYHEPGVRRKLERILGIRINRWDRDPSLENGVFYHAFASGRQREVPGIHTDIPAEDITVVVYLTPGLPVDCGTSLWQHRSTALAEAPDAVAARRLRMRLAALREQLEVDSRKRRRWIEIDRVGYRFNRMVAYPSGAFHSATRHYGDKLGNGRIYQTFRIGVDWSSFRLERA